MTLEELEELGIKYLSSDSYKNDKKVHDKGMGDRDKFCKRFTPTKIKSMTLDEYVEGKKSKTSFCYLIEFGMQSLGQIRGSFANSKFALHYSDKDKKYTFSQGKFGTTLDEVFENVKKEIVKLIEDGEKDNYVGLDNNKLSPMFRGKIYFVYYPGKSLPVYNSDHIDLFMKLIGIDFSDKELSYFAKIRKMLEWKNKSKVFKEFTNLAFVSFLYNQTYGFGCEIAKLKSKEELDEMEVEFITDKDVIDRAIKESTKSHRTPNFEEINRKKSAVGTNAEKIVLRQEKKNNKKYASKIKSIADDPSYGYDILSFDKAGKEKHIEVKSCSSGDINKIDFYITANEKTKLESDESYLIYYVCGLSTKKPKIFIFNKDNLKDATFNPIAYKITGKIKT